MRLHGYTYLPVPQNDAHVRSSMATIEDAVAMAARRSAAVLGAGGATEIPVDHLCASFDRVDFVDIDPAALGALERRLGATGPSFRCHRADLTGLIEALSAEALAIVTAGPQRSEYLPRLAALLRQAHPRFWCPPEAVSYDLVVCSGVLTQLQASVRGAIERVVLEAHPGAAAALAAAPEWRASTMEFARGLEAAFLRHVDHGLAAPDGVVYLADTVRVTWLLEVDPDILATRGYWLATRTGRLADYLDPSHKLVIEREWPWFRRGPEGPYWGRLYGVQANVYRRQAVRASG